MLCALVMLAFCWVVRSEVSLDHSRVGAVSFWWVEDFLYLCDYGLCGDVVIVRGKSLPAL